MKSSSHSIHCVTAGNLLENLFRGDEAHFYTVHRVPGDGKCFYYSLSRCLTGGIQNADLLKQLAEHNARPDVASVTRCNSSADSTNVENIERKLNIKCVFLSKSRPLAGNPRLPRVICTPFGDAVDPGATSDMPWRATRYVFMAYDEESHFSPVTFRGQGHFGLDEIPANLRHLMLQALPPVRELLLLAESRQ